MRTRPFYFEIKDMLTQFIAAFDDIVIGRFNKDREEEDRINVRYLYAPKQRVLHDIINENKTITLPAVAVNIANISRDENRVFNKIDGFYYAQGSSSSLSGRSSSHIKPPVPVNITFSVSIITRYQTDMDQILSNFVPFCNPYIIISWPVPAGFNLPNTHEIRSEVLWDGTISIDYPVELVSNQKARITADTTFILKGWLFKDTDSPAGNIYYINTSFNAVSAIEDYDIMSELNNPVDTMFQNPSLIIFDTLSILDPYYLDRETTIISSPSGTF